MRLQNYTAVEAKPRMVLEFFMKLEGYIDHTFLGAAGSSDAIDRLCIEAKAHSFCSVCVNPAQVPLAKKLLLGSQVKVCTVVGFPLGQNTLAVKRFEAEEAIANGADELDFVINIRLLKYAPNACQEELDSLVCACRKKNSAVELKLIIECCYLTDEEKVLACQMAKRAGFDFVKTSTGFGPSGAKVEDVALMRSVVGLEMGVKAAGSIRTLKDAEMMVEAGASRLGCSASVAIVLT